eukprot:m.356728 g.356728  ORF g.356728 m.356728 type:complete len:177 (+) comp20755_c0_seq8:1770-2300(+)
MRLQAGDNNGEYRTDEWHRRGTKSCPSHHITQLGTCSDPVGCVCHTVDGMERAGAAWECYNACECASTYAWYASWIRNVMGPAVPPPVPTGTPSSDVTGVSWPRAPHRKISVAEARSVSSAAASLNVTSAKLADAMTLSKAVRGTLKGKTRVHNHAREEHTSELAMLQCIALSVNV